MEEEEEIEVGVHRKVKEDKNKHFQMKFGQH